jgi:hypothetical protein
MKLTTDPSAAFLRLCALPVRSIRAGSGACDTHSSTLSDGHSAGGTLEGGKVHVDPR